METSPGFYLFASEKWTYIASTLSDIKLDLVGWRNDLLYKGKGYMEWTRMCALIFCEPISQTTYGLLIKAFYQISNPRSNPRNLCYVFKLHNPQTMYNYEWHCCLFELTTSNYSVLNIKLKLIYKNFKP